jgi:hypothetical protein
LDRSADHLRTRRPVGPGARSHTPEAWGRCPVEGGGERPRPGWVAAGPRRTNLPLVTTWLTDHWDSALGIAVGVLGVAVGILVPIWQRKPKTLDYEVRTKLPLLSPHAKSASPRLSLPLQLHYGDELIKDPFLLALRIENTGKVAIVESDYVAPILVICEDQVPFDGFVSDSCPGGLDLATLQDSPDTSLLRLKPKLLNAGDWFELQLLCDGDPGRVVVTARFSDQTRPVRDSVDYGRRRSSRLRLVRYAVAFSIAFPYALFENRNLVRHDVLNIVFATALGTWLISGLVLFMISVLHYVVAYVRYAARR